MGLITETNAHYYSGQQGYVVPASGGVDTILWKGNEPLKSTIAGVQNSNYRVLKNNVALVENEDYTLSDNTITITGETSATDSLVYGDIIVIELLQETLENNYGGYAYTTLNDIVNNFIVAYVGEGKLIPRVKRTDVIFHAKRGLQEFSYDTINSIKSQELTVPLNLSIIMPQDYVSLVAASYIDELGVKRFIYSTDLTSSPSNLPIQDGNGIPLQDNFSENIEASSSITEERFAAADTNKIIGNTFVNSMVQADGINSGIIGQRYGLEPRSTQRNGWYVINKREGKVSFSSDLANMVIILEYVSDGLAYDVDTKVPKMAEEAMYAHLSYSILAGRSNQPEYVIRRLKQEKTAKLRNAKIRLSNINLKDISQVMRNKSKWIKH